MASRHFVTQSSREELRSSRNLLGEEHCVISPKSVCVEDSLLEISLNICWAAGRSSYKQYRSGLNFQTRNWLRMWQIGTHSFPVMEICNYISQGRSQKEIITEAVLFFCLFICLQPFKENNNKIKVLPFAYYGLASKLLYYFKLLLLTIKTSSAELGTSRVGGGLEREICVRFPSCSPPINFYHFVTSKVPLIQQRCSLFPQINPKPFSCTCSLEVNSHVPLFLQTTGNPSEFSW